MVITRDSESRNPSSNLGRTCSFFLETADVMKAKTSVIMRLIDALIININKVRRRCRLKSRFPVTLGYTKT